jgi:hypothetical protein
MSEEWILEKILFIKEGKNGKETQYQVKWKGYNEKEWRTEEELIEFIGDEEFYNALDEYEEPTTKGSQPHDIIQNEKSQTPKQTKSEKTNPEVHMNNLKIIFLVILNIVLHEFLFFIYIMFL